MAEISDDPFAQSSDLWLIPPPRSSVWFAIIDWYLNWQLSKGLAYPGLHLPNEVLRLAEDYEVSLPAIESAEDDVPLMVISRNRLPATKCVVVDTGRKFEDWLKQAMEITLNLDAKNLHIFLPAKASKTQAQTLWTARFKDRVARFSTDEEAKEPSK